MTEQQAITVNASTHILVVDDAMDIRLLLNFRLQSAGYKVTTAGSGAAALKIAKQEGLPHLIILDIVMPKMDGIAVAKAFRRMGDTPIIFLSALSDTNTKVKGLNDYAEDYITKPFAVSELLARVRRVLLRAPSTHLAEPELIIDESLRINFSQQYVVVDDIQIALTPTENRLIHLLHKHRGRVLSPDFLLTKAWDPVHQGTVGSLWIHILRLRSKVEPNPENPRYIVTVRGQGYCFPQPRNIAYLPNEHLAAI